jgi:electron transfer flavoprotein beta subunit
MPYNIAVCVKPVPDPKYYDKVVIDPISKTINRSGIPTLINPVDKNAIELALRLREHHSGTIAAIAMAPMDSKDILREPLAMGVDSAYLLSDRDFGGADTLATSYTLYHGIKKIEDTKKCVFDFVFCGNESSDSATAQVSSQLGEWFQFPHLWNVSFFEEVEGKEDVFSIRTKLENGYMEWIGRPPLVLGISKEINKPRFISVKGIMNAKQKSIVIWNRADINTAENRYIGLNGSPTKAGKIFHPELKRSGKFVIGTPEEAVENIVSILKSNGVTIGA